MIALNAGLIETRSPWAAIGQIEDVGAMVIFWYRGSGGFFIPSRAFANDMERRSFVAWAAERLKAGGSAGST